MTHLKLTLRGPLAGPAILIGVILTVACSGRTNPEQVGAAPSSDSDTPSADDAVSSIGGHAGGLYGPCIGNDDGTRGSCDEGELCGSMPDVGYSYCMQSVPCAADMVPVLNLACAYPCDGASVCLEHGLSKCAANTLSDFGGPAGWCTP